MREWGRPQLVLKVHTLHLNAPCYVAAVVSVEVLAVGIVPLLVEEIFDVHHDLSFKQV